MTAAPETRFFPVLLNHHTYSLLRRAAKLEGETLVGTIYEALRARIEAYGERHDVPSPFCVGRVAKGVRLSHADARTITLTPDEAHAFTEAIMIVAGRCEGVPKLEMVTQVSKVTVRVWNGGRFVGITIGASNVGMPRPAALDLADAIRAAI